MTKRGIQLFASLTVTILLPVYFLIQVVLPAYNQVQAEDGYLDLSRWNSRNGGTVQLNGEWTFYPGQLLTPSDMERLDAEGGVRAETIQVPGNWNKKLKDEDGKKTAVGYATYRLRMKLGDESESVYGIRTTNIRMANRIFMNGREIGSSGAPEASPDKNTQGNIPYVGFASVKGGTVDLIIQVTNYSYSTGGIIHPVLFGSQASILKARELAVFKDAVILAGILVPAIFSCCCTGCGRSRSPCSTWGCIAWLPSCIFWCREKSSWPLLFRPFRTRSC